MNSEKENKKEGNSSGAAGKHEHPLPQEISKKQQEINEAAHEQAEHDMEEDPDISIHSPNDDLDEGEFARLGEDETDLV